MSSPPTECVIQHGAKPPEGSLHLPAFAGVPMYQRTRTGVFNHEKEKSKMSIRMRLLEE